MRKPSDFFEHPQRGSILENWVYTELNKGFANRGQLTGLYFWRDIRGDEIDFLLECDGEAIPLEVKSGRTVQPMA